MNARDAAEALEEVRVREDQTLAAATRPWPWWSVVGTGLLLFATGVAFEYNGESSLYWILCFLGIVALNGKAGLGAQAKVHASRYTTRTFVVVGLQVGGPLVAYTLARLAAQEAGAGAPSTVGGAALAVTWVLAAPWLQREFAASVRRGAR